jgi:hypothetical protein
VPDTVVEMQLQRGGAVEVAMGGQPSHAVKAVAGGRASMVARCRVVRGDNDAR